MSDSPILHRLRAGLDTLTADVRATPPPLPRVGRTSSDEHERPDDRGHRWLAAAAAALLVAGAAGIWYVGRSNDGATNLDEPPVDATIGTPPQLTQPDDIAIEQLTTLPIPVVPDGWETVEWGAVRFALPAGLRFFGACSTGFDPETVTLTIVCNEDATDPTVARVTITISEGTTENRSDFTVVDLNGLEAIDLGDPGCDGCPPWRALTALDLEIGIGGPVGSETLVEQIWSTVTASGSWRAERLPAPTVPDGWIDVDYEGLTVSVPPDWPVYELGDGETGPGMCGTGSPREAAVVTGFDLMSVSPDCPEWEWNVLHHPADGVNILPDSEVPDPPTGWPLMTSSYTTADGYSTDLRVYVGFGDDPTIGATILGSIRPTGSG